jgi:hypothetical protein
VGGGRAWGAVAREWLYCPGAGPDCRKGACGGLAMRDWTSTAVELVVSYISVEREPTCARKKLIFLSTIHVRSARRVREENHWLQTQGFEPNTQIQSLLQGFCTGLHQRAVQRNPLCFSAFASGMSCKAMPGNVRNCKTNWHQN